MLKLVNISDIKTIPVQTLTHLTGKALPRVEKYFETLALILLSPFAKTLTLLTLLTVEVQNMVAENPGVKNSHELFLYSIPLFFP